MELLLLAILGVSLLVADRYVNYSADRIAGTAFDRMNEVIDNVSYFGQTACPVRKQHIKHTVIPLLPSIHHEFNVLSRTECGHWFLFSADVDMLELEKTSIRPLEPEQAKKALNDRPELMKKFFSDTTKEATSNQASNKQDSGSDHSDHTNRA